MSETALTHGLAIALGIYSVLGAAGLAAVQFVRLQGEEARADPRLAIHMEVVRAYASGRRLLALGLALAGYALAALALANGAGAAYPFYAGALALETITFLSWRGRGAMVHTMGPAERWADAAAALGLLVGLCVLANMRFSGAMS